MTESILTKIRAEQSASKTELASFAKKIADYKSPISYQSEIVAASVKNLYFMTGASQLLVSETKNIKRNRDLDEGQIVLLEIKKQLLAAQIERALDANATEIEFQEAVLGMLLNQQVIEVNGILLKLKELWADGDTNSIENTIDTLLSIYSLLNKDNLKVTRNCSEKVVNRVLG